MTPAPKPAPDLYQIGQDIAATKTLVLELHHRLFGNGQRGEIADLRSEVDLIKQSRLEERVRRRTLRWAAGILWAFLTTAWGVIVAQAPLVKSILHKLGW